MIRHVEIAPTFECDLKRLGRRYCRICQEDIAAAEIARISKGELGG